MSRKENLVISFYTDETMGGDGKTRMCVGKDCFKIDEDPGKLMVRLKGAVRQGRGVGIDAIAGVVPRQLVELVPRVFKGVREEIRKDDEIERLNKEGARQREGDVGLMPGEWVANWRFGIEGNLEPNDLERVGEVVEHYKSICRGRTVFPCESVFARKNDIYGMGVFGDKAWTLSMASFYLKTYLDYMRNMRFRNHKQYLQQMEQGEAVAVEARGLILGRQSILEAARAQYLHVSFSLVGLCCIEPVSDLFDTTGYYGKAVTELLLGEKVANFGRIAGYFEKIVRFNCGEAPIYTREFPRHVGTRYWAGVLRDQANIIDERTREVRRQAGNGASFVKVIDIK